MSLVPLNERNEVAIAPSTAALFANCAVFRLAHLRGRSPAFTVATVVSVLFSPSLVSTSLGLGVAASASPTLQLTAWRWTAAYIFLTSFVPLLYIAGLMYRRKVIELCRRRNRVRPLAFTVGCSIAGLIMLIMGGAPNPLRALAVGHLVTIAVLAVITIFWKISLHSAAIGAAAALCQVLGAPIALAVWGLVPLVGWSRLKLRRHTMGQVVAGAVVGGLLLPGVFWLLR